MSGSDAIFRLVKAMTRSEKRHLKALSEIYGKNGKEYMRLFDVLDSMDIYEDEEVKAAAKELGIENLSFQKGYLMKNVLKTLRWSDKDEDSSVWAEVRDIQSLFDKRVFKDVQKRINKATKNAEASEEFSAQLELIELQIRYWKEIQDFDNYNEYVQPKIDEKLVLIGKIQNQLQIQKVFELVFQRFIQQPRCRTDEERDTINEVIGLLESSPELRPRSVRATILKNQALVKAYSMILEHDVCYRCANEIIELYESNPAIKERLYETYLYSVVDYCAFAIESGNRSSIRIDFDSLLKEMSAEETKYASARNRLLYFLLGDSIELGEIERARKVASAVVAELKQNARILRPESVMIDNFLLAYFHFVDGDFRRCRQFTEEVFEYAKAGVRKDLHAITRIFNLLVFLEIGENDLLHYELRNTRGFLSRRGIVFKFEKIVLKLIGRSANSVSIQEITDRFVAAAAELEELWEDPFEARVNIYFDFRAWIQSKIEKRRMIEVIREKSSSD